MRQPTASFHAGFGQLRLRCANEVSVRRRLPTSIAHARCLTGDLVLARRSVPGVIVE